MSTLAGTLGFIADVSFTAIGLVMIAEYFGYTEAESRAAKIWREYSLRGETVPEELEVPRNLLPKRFRSVGAVVVKVAFVVGLTAFVAYWIVK